MLSTTVGFAEFVLSHLDRTPSRVLEIGCGDGQDALALAASGHEVTAIDPVAPDGPIFERVTLEEFARSDPFDAVVASRSLHHVPDLALAVDKIAQLAPLLIVEEFAWDRLDERTAAWYLTQLDGPSKSVQQCLRDWTRNTPACTAPRLCGQRSIGASVNASSPGAPTSTGMPGYAPTRRANSH